MATYTTNWRPASPVIGHQPIQATPSTAQRPEISRPHTDDDVNDNIGLS